MTHRKLLYLIMASIVAATLLLMSGVILAHGPASFPGHAGSNPQQTAGSASYRIAMLGDMTTTNYCTAENPVFALESGRHFSRNCR